MLKTRCQLNFVSLQSIMSCILPIIHCMSLRSWELLGLHVCTQLPTPSNICRTNNSVGRELLNLSPWGLIQNTKDPSKNQHHHSTKRRDAIPKYNYYSRTVLTQLIVSSQTKHLEQSRESVKKLNPHTMLHWEIESRMQMTVEGLCF